VTDENPVSPKYIVRLNNKIDDIRCAMQIFILIIILIFAIQILQITESRESLVYGWSTIIFFVIAAVLLIGVISILCTNDNQNRIESSNVQKESSDAPAGT
jgi:protein-S-isoprenylcysteine O-methyltransferase Ste14